MLSPGQPSHQKTIGPDHLNLDRLRFQFALPFRIGADHEANDRIFPASSGDTCSTPGVSVKCSISINVEGGDPLIMGVLSKLLCCLKILRR